MNKLTHLLRQRWYPILPQIIVAVLFGFMILDLLVGQRAAGQNSGSIITWLLWWPLVPITFIFVGRLWCAICPFGALGDWLRRTVGLNRAAPAWLKKNGIWFINGGFFLISWYEVTFGLTKSVPATTVVLLTVLLAAVIFSLVFERRTWCRYLCFLGGIFGNYSQTAAIELRGTKEICAACSNQNCFHGNGTVDGCSLFISPKTITSNRTCNFCGDCVKTCANGSPQVLLREKTGNELWQKLRPRFDESFLAVSLVGIIFISTLGMLIIWPPLVNLIAPTGIFTKEVITTIYLVLVVGAGIAVYAGAAWLSANLIKEKFVANFSRFGYALIPLNLATHIAHNLMHFLGEGRVIGRAMWMLFLPTLSAAAETEAPAAEHGASALVPIPLIAPIQFVVVGIGIMLSFYVIKKISDRDKTGLSSWPHYVVIALFGFAAFWMFSLPMLPRH